MKAGRITLVVSTLLISYIDLPPASRTSLKLVKSVNHQENDGHEEEQIHRGTDHQLPQAG